MAWAGSESLERIVSFRLMEWFPLPSLDSSSRIHMVHQHGIGSNKFHLK